MPCIAIAVHPFNGCSRTWHQLFKSRIPSPQLLDATLTSYYIILHPPTSPRSMQYIYVRLYNIVTCSLVLDDYGNLEGSQLKALLTGFQAPPNSLNPIWKATFCMTGWSHASPPMQHFKRYHNSTKKHRIWQYDSIPALVTLEQASVSKVILIDWIGSQRQLFGVFGRVWSQILPDKHRSHVNAFGRPTFHWMAWFFEEGKLAISSFHQSKTPRKQKRYLNI